jgi:hypothetical protein
LTSPTREEIILSKKRDVFFSAYFVLLSIVVKTFHNRFDTATSRWHLELLKYFLTKGIYSQH